MHLDDSVSGVFNASTFLIRGWSRIGDSKNGHLISIIIFKITRVAFSTQDRSMGVNRWIPSEGWIHMKGRNGEGKNCITMVFFYILDDGGWVVRSSSLDDESFSK